MLEPLKNLPEHIERVHLGAVTCEWENQNHEQCGVLVGVEEVCEHYRNTHEKDDGKCRWPGCTKRFREADRRRTHYGLHCANATMVCRWTDNRGGVCGSQFCHTNIVVGQIQAHIKVHIWGTGA